MSLATNVATIHQNKMADSEMESTDVEHPPSETSGNAADSEATPEPRKLDEEMHDNKISEAQEGESNVRVEETLVLQAPIEEVSVSFIPMCDFLSSCLNMCVNM